MALVIIISSATARLDGVNMRSPGKRVTVLFFGRSHKLDFIEELEQTIRLPARRSRAAGILLVRRVQETCRCRRPLCRVTKRRRAFRLPEYPQTLSSRRACGASWR